MTWRITSHFGEQEAFRKNPHNGIDFAMKEGEELYSITEGVIKYVDYGDKNAGKTVMIENEQGLTFIYGHLSKFNNQLKSGDSIEKDQLIGYSGNTGHSTGNHLHFGVKFNDQYIDPSQYIDQIQNMGNEAGIFSNPHHSILDLLSNNQEQLTEFINIIISNIVIWFNLLF
ncbi:M23 family metallopeptidase [Halalkalibacter oceani]|uniref:M23 family metallopeptidase n=1 Tax=Halalkalibacter oceani TaxID=1653776 RepID=UPI0033927D9A